MIWIGIAIVINGFIIGGCLLNIADAIIGDDYRDDTKKTRKTKSKTNKIS